MLFSTMFLLGSCFAYMVLNDGDNKTKEVKEVKEEIESNFEKTYKYFLDELTLDEQIEYVNYNLDLQNYRHLLTDSKYFNAKKFANLSEKLGKEFTNINKKYYL